MELREFRVFLAVADEGSVSAAARRLRVSQPAVSQTIAALEQQTGVELLVRHSTGVELTDAGAVLATEARAVLARYDQALTAIGQFAGTGGTDLRIGVPLEFPSHLLPDAVTALVATHPRTRVALRHLSSATQLDALRAGELDLGLLRTRPADRDLDAMVVVEEKLGVLLAAAAEPAGPDGIRLETLAGLSWVGFPRADSPAWFDEIAAVLRSHGLHPGPPAGAGQSLIAEVKLAAVSAGQAFAFAPEKWLQPLPPGVVWTALKGSPLVRRTWAVWPADSRRRDLAALVSHLDQGP
ncbi:LysR family transcriptional regulator [Actinoplanes sp. N902-109]|uniref:LysR family transcriptional regulator n=1 Tax=Actinoplanes sp. (strain N902-109) TaxID=649831 RepID=UPI0003293E03|nr:LysR family transcriptional regulator [Actinoplanes sp. N902-109]AGL16244.1 LysR family transcriptional regulator [Actinoplanes sp. N902-109]